MTPQPCRLLCPAHIREGHPFRVRLRETPRRRNPHGGRTWNKAPSLLCLSTNRAAKRRWTTCQPQSRPPVMTEVRRNKFCRLQGADTPLVHKQATANAGHGAFGYRATLTNYPAFKLQASGMGTAARFLYKPSCPEKDSSLERIVFTQPTIKLSRSGFNTFPAPGEDAYVSLSTRILSHRLRRIIFFPASSKFWLTLLEWEALRGLLSKLRMTQTVVLGTNQYKSWRLECS